MRPTPCSANPAHAGVAQLANSWWPARTTDRGGNLWVGASPGGFACLDPQGRVLRHFDVRSGIQSDHIFGIAADLENRIWVATGNGLFRSAPAGDPPELWANADRLRVCMVEQQTP